MLKIRLLLKQDRIKKSRSWKKESLFLFPKVLISSKGKITSFYSIFKVCLCLSSQGFLMSAAAVVIWRNLNTHRYILKPGQFNLKYILALECPWGWNRIAQEMNNGIHYYDQLKSNITQGIPSLLSSLEIVESSVAPLQVISYPNTEAINKGVFSSCRGEVYLFL